MDLKKCFGVSKNVLGSPTMVDIGDTVDIIDIVYIIDTVDIIEIVHAFVMVDLVDIVDILIIWITLESLWIPKLSNPIRDDLTHRFG